MAIVSILLGGVLGLFTALIACTVFQAPFVFGIGLYFATGFVPVMAMTAVSWIAALRENIGLTAAHRSM